jgi:hypothetical protein
MVIDMRDNISKVSHQVKADMIGLMVVIMKENLKRV